jgi:hypothetical protein
MRGRSSTKPIALAGGAAWAALIVLIITRSIPFEVRSYDELARVGLSLKNYIEIAGTVVVGLWTARYLWGNRISVQRLYYGHWRWFLSLCAVYLLSATWSLMPTMTIYRVADLLVASILVLTIFRSSATPSRGFLFLAYVCMLQCLVSQAALAYMSGDWPSYVVGFLRSNPGGGIATATLVFAIFAEPGQIRWRSFHIVSAVTASILFGSLASFLAFLVAVIYGLVAGRFRLLGFAMIALALSIVALGAIADVSVSTPERYLSTLYGKSMDQVQTATGRVGLWHEAFRFLADRPMGAGYVAGERLMTSMGNVDNSESWGAINSHDGYLSAWMAAGPLGLGLLIAFLFSLYRTLGFCRGGTAVWRAVLVSIMMNNLSVPSVGGQVDVFTIVALAVAAMPLCSGLAWESNIRAAGRREVRLPSAIGGQPTAGLT